MFDDFVEHAGSTPDVSRPSIPQLQNQGFEPSSPVYDLPPEPDAMLTSLETGYFSNNAGVPNTIDNDPLFILGRVQVDITSQLLAFTVQSDMLFMACANDTLIHINLASPEKILQISIPPRTTAKGNVAALAQVTNLFLDPSGRHLIVATGLGENFYLYTKWPQLTLKPLKNFKMVIESVAWNAPFLLSRTSGTGQSANTGVGAILAGGGGVLANLGGIPSGVSPTSSGGFLVGARNGVIYEALLDGKDEFLKAHDRYVNPVFTLPERQPIAGIVFQWFGTDTSTGTADKRDKGLVVVTTQDRIYQFVGPGPDKKSEEGVRMFTALFSAYKGSELKFLELPGATRSELHAQGNSVAWLTGQGIYYGAINYDPSSNQNPLIDSAQLLPHPTVPTSPVASAMGLATSPYGANPSTSPYASPLASKKALSNTGSPDIPVSIGLTEFHFLSLFNERLTSVCNLDLRPDWEEVIPLKPTEKVLGLACDNASRTSESNRTYWVYTSTSLFELKVNNEARDVWQIYLRRGDFDTALKYANTAPQREAVLAAQGDAYLGRGEYSKAAERFAQTSRSFEEVCLRLVDSGDRDALQYYLMARLTRTRKTDLTQRMMLATWLVEFYLSKYNDLDDLIASESAAHDVQDLKAEREMLDRDLKAFFETYQANLDRQTIYDLILSHGRTEVFLHYATVVGDYQRVIEHWVLEEEWDKAIDVLNRQNNLELYYRYAPVLLRRTPKATVDSWIRQPALDPLRLTPALLQLQHQPRDPLLPNQAVRYLNYVIFDQHNTSPTVHNLLITMYASPAFGDDDRHLLRFLSTVPKDIISGKPYYDLDYALRICRQNGRIGPCVTLYAEMGLWENSVDLALEKGDLELAKANADRAEEEDERLKKKLWLKIAKYVVQDKKDIKTAMAFIKDTSLKIEDILPFFPDFVVIDDFKDEICLALEEYTKDIDRLRTEMDEATKSAEAIKKDIGNLKNRFVTLEAGERCSYCSYPLFTRQFYVFPCQHSFHADCLIGMVKEYLPAHALRKILLLQAELVQSAANASPQAGANGNANANANSNVNPQSKPPPTTQRTLLSAQFTAQSNTSNAPNTANAPNAPNANAPSAPYIPSLRPASIIANPMGGLLAVSMAPVSLGRNMFVAADRLRDMIVPDALANAIALPSFPWTGGVGGGANAKKDGKVLSETEMARLEKMKENLDELLASSCPLCESALSGLDKPFVEPDEEDTWRL